MKENDVFAALASTPRRQILAYLSQASLTAGEIAERFEMTRPSLSKHLQVLVNAGLIVSEKRGQFVHYTVADNNLLGTLTGYLTAFCPVGRPIQKESAALARSGKSRRAAAQAPAPAAKAGEGGRS